MRSWILSLVLTICFVTTAHAQAMPLREPARESVASNILTASNTLSLLQESHANDGETFVEQNEIECLIKEGGGGPCASAAGIVTLQALRLMAGLDKISNPHKALLGSLTNQQSLLDGRVTNNQMVRLIQFYAKFLDGASLTVEVQSAPNSPHAVDGNTWASTGVPDLCLEHDELKLLSYTVITAGGEVLGRHFVLLKQCVGEQIDVLDPAHPTKLRNYVLARQTDKCERYFLNNPEGIAARTEVYELNTVFTVHLARQSSSLGTATNIATVNGIAAKIEETATRLAKQNNLRSPRVWRSETAAFGLPRLDLPKEFGGADWPATKMLQIFKHAGRYDLNLRDVVGAAHSRVLLHSKSPEVRGIVQQVADGKAYVAIAITEPDVGSDYTSMTTTSQKVDGGYILNGHKRFNARLDQATHVVVFTKSSTGRTGRLSVFVLPIEAQGLDIERFGAHGLVGNSYGGLKLNNVFVPDSHRIGEEDEGRDIFNEHFRYWRLMQTATALGTAEQALEQLAERLRTRMVNGAPIGRFTHLQQPLGQCCTELRMAESLAIEAARLLDHGDFVEADALICGLKAEGVEIALHAVDAAARAFGGEGYSDLVDIGDRLKDLNGLRIADGATDVMRSAVVAKIYGEEFWEMAIKSKRQSSEQESQ